MSPDNLLEFPGEGRWPHRPDIDDICPFYKMAQLLGANIHDLLLTFIGTAEEGSRLTLQRNQNGFTDQITGAVQRSNEDSLNLAAVLAIGRKLDGTSGNGH